MKNEDPVVSTMKELEIPITREHYINLVHNPKAGPWGYELEATIPEELQDFDKLKKE